MKEFIDSITSISQDPIVSLMGMLVGIAGVIFAWIFYRKSRRYKELVFSMRSTSFVSDYETKIPGLVVLFNDAKIPCVTLTKMAIWNDGPETIAEGDITETDRLRLVVSENREILDVTILKTTPDPICLRTAKNNEKPYEVEIRFEFLDKGDGAILLVTHTDKRLSKPVEVKGTIKNCKPLMYCRSPRVRGTLSILGEGLAGFAIFSIIGYMLVKDLTTQGIVAVILRALIFVLIGLFFYVTAIYRLKELLSIPVLPTALKEYQETTVYLRERW